MRKIFLLIIFLLPITIFAQLKKANKAYEHYDYAYAIELYKRVLERNEDAEAIEKLANCYRLVRDYKNAELFYARLFTIPDIKPINNYYYGMVLKNNKKLDSARVQFELYYKTVPENKLAEQYVKSCDDIKLWIKKTQQFDVSPVVAVNTVHSEFCPVIHNNKLYFTSDRTKDILNNYTYSWNKQPYLNVYSADVIDTMHGNNNFSTKAKPLEYPINTEYHDGPLCFNNSQNILMITRVGEENRKKENDFVNRPKLFIYTALKNETEKWNDPKAFSYNSDNYSTAHPSLSVDGNWLFFSSDMPGGYGGTDIYMSKKEGNEWSKPENLGSDINTPADEVFPFIRKDSVLYFSSDGHSGFGGLDIFSADKMKGKFTNVSNLGNPLNSSTDDFGIFFNDDITKGYFSSDRSGGKGADDIYQFIALRKFISIKGKLLVSPNINDPLKNAKVKLYTMEGNYVKSIESDSSGNFEFIDLDPDQKYNIKLDETNPELAKIDRVYLADHDDKIIKVTVVNNEGEKFEFRDLPFDESTLPIIPANEEITFAGNLLYGTDGKPLANTTVNLVDDKGEIVETTTTNHKGAFVFRNLPTDKNYIVKIDETDTELPAHTRVSITDKAGKEVQSTTISDKGKFDFVFLATDQTQLNQMKAEDSELRFDFKGRLSGQKEIKKSPLSNSIIHLVDVNGNVIQTTKTDKLGGFHFDNLPTDKTILFTLEEADYELKNYSKLFITDDKGNVIKEFVRNNKGTFDFQLLPAEIEKFGNIYVEDTPLTTVERKKQNQKTLNEIMIREPGAIKSDTNSKEISEKKSRIETPSTNNITTIYYDLKSYSLSESSVALVYKAIEQLKANSDSWVEVLSYTDSRGSNSFNYKLSQKRTSAVKKYFTESGIDSSRISGEAYGERFPMNRCNDGIKCSEQEYSKNRRTEIIIYSK